MDNFMSNSVVCIPGPAAKTSVITVNLSGQLLSSLKNFISQVDQTRFFGSLEADQRVEIPQNFDRFNTISSYGSILKFDHATYDDILKLSLENTLILKGQLIIKTISEEGSLSPVSRLLSPSSPRLLIVPLGDFSSVDTTGGPAELSVLVKSGDTLVAGSILAKISTPSELKVLNRISSLGSRKASLQSRKEIAIVRLRSSVRSAEEKLEKVEQDYTVKLDLYSKSLASRAELENVEGEKSAAQSDLENLNQILESTDKRYQDELRNTQNSINKLRLSLAASQNKRLITSPVDGIVVELRSTPKSPGKASYSIVLRLLDHSFKGN